MKLIKSIPSPNYSKRTSQIDTLVLHYTGMQTAESAIERLCDEQAKVSSHYVVLENGEILQLVAEDKKAWHAGQSYWANKTNLNDNSIGIEIVNKGHEFGYTHFPKIQMQSVIDLCLDILKRHHIPAYNIVAHSDIAPTRKQDPGELFNWKELADNNIGLWTDELCPITNSVEKMLSTIGYDTSDLEFALTAFQRRFYPEAILKNTPDTLQRLSAVAFLYENEYQRLT